MSHNNIRFFFGSLHLEKVKFVKGDILNHIELARQRKEIDVVFHLAGVVKSPYSLEDSLKYEQINQWGTANLVQSIEKMESVRKLIFLSSASVRSEERRVGKDWKWASVSRTITESA